jgi:tRNA pseudouridine38-40 synthase
MKNYLATVRYNGKQFSGWVKQNNAKTIQGTIEKAIKKVIKNDNFKTIGASKTDAGVHAFDQKVLFVLEFEPQLEGFRKALNSNLRPDIYIADFVEVSSDFKIRNNKSKTYTYEINFGEYDLLSNDFEWRITNKFDVNKFTEAMKLFVGTHDFKNFCGLKEEEMVDIKTIREIFEITFELKEHKIKTFITGKGFIRYQIRMMVGAAAAYATGKIDLQNISNVLNLVEPKMKYIANPEGLMLKEIKY